MTDYKNLCNWRRDKMIHERKKTAQAMLFMILAVLIYGFVGYLEQPPVAVESAMPVAKVQTLEGR